MPRPISWLPRLYDITRSVSNSVRSDYERRDLESLFQLQPRMVQKLLQLMPTIKVGKGHLVSRDSLLNFLEQVHQADDVPLLFEQLRQQQHKAVKKKLRQFVQTDHIPQTLESLPQHVKLSPGQMHVSFQTVDELAECLMKIAQILSEDTEQFAKTYEPQKPQQIEEPDEVSAMFAELEAMEVERAKQKQDA